MEIEEGRLLEIHHSRKGKFVAVALADFDTEEAQYWPVAVAEGYVAGSTCDWMEGEAIPCRAGLVIDFWLL